MAGSRDHLLDEEGEFTFRYIENMGDAEEACRDCFNIILEQRKQIEKLTKGCDDCLKVKTEMDRVAALEEKHGDQHMMLTVFLRTVLRDSGLTLDAAAFPRMLNEVAQAFLRMERESQEDKDEKRAELEARIKKLEAKILARGKCDEIKRKIAQHSETPYNPKELIDDLMEWLDWAKMGKGVNLEDTN